MDLTINIVQYYINYPQSWIFQMNSSIDLTVFVNIVLFWKKNKSYYCHFYLYVHHLRIIFLLILHSGIAITMRNICDFVQKKLSSKVALWSI